MSVINTMLQDLEARAGRAGQSPLVAHLPPAPLPVPLTAPVLDLASHPARRRVLLIALAGALAVATWPAGETAAPAARPAPPAVQKSITLAPVTLAPPLAVPNTVPDAVPDAVPNAVPVVVKAAESLPVPVIVRAPLSPPPPPPLAVASLAKAPAATAAPRLTDSAGSTGGAVDSPYRRALASLAAGRKAEAIGELELALQAHPRENAARETLVGLLLEGHRRDEAMAQLEAALALEPRQLAMAMLLARLQIEGGADGIDTLRRSLPFVEAGEGAAYHAMLAGALQRRQRHDEAVTHYQAALQLAPDNGVWLTGLGLSLRASGRAADALDAFRRARASGALPPALAAVVDQQLQPAR